MIFQRLWFLGCVSSLCAETLILPVKNVELVADMGEKVFPGRVVAVAQVNVVPQVSGEILEVGFKNGAAARAGDLLYRLDSVKYEAAVKNAEAKVAENKASLGYAELSYTRHLKLVKTRAVSQDAVDNALSARDSARATLAASQADLTSARDDLRHCRIIAPIAGVLGSTQFTEGNYIQKGQGTLVSLIQTSPIRVKFSISNREYLELFRGNMQTLCEEGHVQVMLADGSILTENGTIEYTENAADELTDTVQVYALFPNTTQRLKVGGTVTVTLTSKKGTMRPCVPPTAVLQDVQGPYVWVVQKDGHVEYRPIARGNMIGNKLCVELGLKGGERIVTEGAHKVTKKSIVEAAK